MTTRKAKEVSSRLCSKGFTRNEDADHCQFFFSADGLKTTIRTKMSHGEREIGEALIQRMAKQLRLSKHELLDLVDCKMDKEIYLQLMIERDKVDSQRVHRNDHK